MASLPVLLVATQIATPQIAVANPDPGMCAMSPARGTVPANFVIDACVDGSAIWLHNERSLVVPFIAAGDVGPVQRSSGEFSLAAIATRLAFADPLLLVPGDTARVPIGPGAASVKVGLAPANENAGAFYAVALTVEAFFPIPGVASRAKDVYDVFVGLIRDVVRAFQNYQRCLVGKAWLAQEGCKVTLAATILGHLAVGDVKLLVHTNPVLSALLDAATYLSFLAAIGPDADRILNAPGMLTQAAVTTARPSTARPTTSAGAGGGTAPAPPSTVSATAVAPDTVRVTWSDNSNNETSFVVASGGVTDSVRANVTSFDWHGLAPGSQLCVRVRADNNAGASAFVPASPVCATTPTVSMTPPSFVYPVNGQTLGIDGDYLFKVTSVPYASGYLFGFFQDGQPVWENYHDEGVLSGTEYGIGQGTAGHARFHAGPVEVWVRAYVFDQWTDATIITIYLG